MARLSVTLAAAAALIAGCGGDDGGDADPARSDTPTIQVRATSGDASLLLGPTSTCADGAPRDITLACGIPAPHRRTDPLPVRPGAPIELRFEARVGRLLAQQQRAGRAGPVEDLTQLRPLRPAGDRTRWTLRAPARVERDSAIALVALYEEPVHIRHLTSGGTVPLEDAVLQFQVPLAPRR